MKRMLLAPHADDETFGAGGYLAKYSDTIVVVIAQMLSQRSAEFDRSMERLGIYQTECLGLVDGQVGQDPQYLTERIDGLFRTHKPDEVLLPAPGTHQDHVAVYQAGLRSCRLSMSGWHHMPPNVLAYDIPAYGLDLAPTGLQWTWHEQLDIVHVRRKGEACACYESQLPNEDHPAATETVHSAARVAGADVGVLFAERFAPVRMVR